MLLAEVLGCDVAIKKTVWSKRGDKVTRRVVNKDADFDIEPKTHFEIETKTKKNENHNPLGNRK